MGVFTSLHSTMFLLNLDAGDYTLAFYNTFTFHDVSIKSKTFGAKKYAFTHLYIPRCFY